MINETVDIKSKIVSIKVIPDKRYTPKCHSCNNISHNIHSYHERVIRDLNMFDAKTFIRYSCRKIRCHKCDIMVEDLDIVEPNTKVTKRLAHYILQLCKFMTINVTSGHFFTFSIFCIFNETFCYVYFFLFNFSFL